MNDQLLEQIKNCPTLPSLPSIAVQVLKLAQSSEVDLGEIATVISKDPALSGKILKTVNSSFYGRSQAVGTISHALVVLGIQSVKTLVLGFSLVTNLTTKKGFQHLTFWRRSIYAATAARQLAAKLGVMQQEEAFLAALLHDIGMLVLDAVLGEQYSELCARSPSHDELAKIETEALGMSHAEVGGVLAAQWKLPPVLEIPVGWHDRAEKVQDATLRKLTEIVALSGMCASVFVEENPVAAIAQVRKVFNERYKLSQADCDKLMAEIGSATKEVASLFEINIGKTADFKAVLARANEALVAVSLQTQQQSVDLQKQNQVLQKKASTDALTGLANRAVFDTTLEQTFAARGSEPMALIMLDLDHFKQVNDRHGHQVGDAVLRTVSRMIQAGVRQGDLVARYGGEEIVLILPKTNRAGATAIAEMLRRVLAAKPLSIGAAKLQISASFGVAAVDVDSPFADAAQLLSAADLATYHAKRSGRNCVKVYGRKPGATPATAGTAAPALGSAPAMPQAPAKPMPANVTPAAA